MLDKNLIIEIIDLCSRFATGQQSGEITKETYTDKFKIPYLQPFEEHHLDSPAVLIKKHMLEFYEKEIKPLHNKFKIKSFGFWGNNIYSYVWACIYYDFGNIALPASYSPQLYILINKKGIKFGFCYGNEVVDDDHIAMISNNQRAKDHLLDIFSKGDAVNCFRTSTDEITALPEELFEPNDRIIFDNIEQYLQEWNSRILLIKEYQRESIPDGISKEIIKTLQTLKNFFVSLLPVDNINQEESRTEVFSCSDILKQSRASHFIVSENIMFRFVSSLATKQFVILTGLSGSGKTKLAEIFAKWICGDKKQYKLIPVGADWTNREPLLGYPNALDLGKYVKPDNGLLNLLIDANKHENKDTPYFIILDEMNLSHVERYFADFLSVMESGEPIPLRPGGQWKDDVPPEINLPDNVFIIGTVNIDETTYMFSPKVLDRANVIEFRVTEEEMKEFLKNPAKPELERLAGKGSGMAADFLAKARAGMDDFAGREEINKRLAEFFAELKKTGAEFGYRTAYEIHRFADRMIKLTSGGEDSISINEIIDAAIMQKLLPKLHGSKSRLEPVLKTLMSFCTDDAELKEKLRKGEDELKPEENNKIIFKLSFEKLARMKKRVKQDGFTSYAEA